jgi:hypothetical protein
MSYLLAQAPIRNLLEPKAADFYNDNNYDDNINCATPSLRCEILSSYWTEYDVSYLLKYDAV